jgi:1-acyl-sn-glycerol-3-phosphate acyltransferase
LSHEYSKAWRTTSVAILRPLLFTMLKRDWRGRENVPRDGGVIIAANHLSWSDPLALAHFVYESGRYPVYLAKDALFDVKGLGHVLRRLGQIPVFRDRADAGLALREAEEGLRAGECLMFYPESTVTRDPDMWPMTGKTGAARLALATGAEVVPVAHWGAHVLWPYGTKKFRPFPRKTMHVIAGPPVDLSKYEGQPLNAQTLEAATSDIMHAIADLLGELRGEKPPEKLYDHRAAIRERRRSRQQPQEPQQQEPQQQKPQQGEETE